jgi:translation initiation factor 2D
LAKKESSGKFLLIRSCYRDALWAMAAAHPARPPLLPNEGFLEKGVVGAEESEHDAGLALDEDEEDEEDDDDGGGGGGGGGALPPNALVETSVVETSVVETHETVDAMDARIDAAFAYAIARRVKNADLPAPSSSFWGRHVSPSRAAGAPPLEARRSSHKKMSRVFAAFAKRGWLTGKEDPRTKEFVVTSVRRTHADIEKFLPSFDSTFETAGDAEARERSDAERDADARASMYTGAAAAAFAAVSSTSSPPLVLERKLRVPASALGVFRALAEAHGGEPERFPFSPDTLYTREGAAAVAEAYCDLADLTKESPSRSHITLDTVLCDALFKGVLKKGEPYPTRLKRRDALGETWLSRFHPVTFVSRGARSATKKGDLAPVRVESERRGGDRKVTRVVGFETYLIEPEELRETLARTLATNCQVADLEATKNRAPGAKAIVAAGNAVEKTRVTLREHYGVPDANIVTKDVFNGKGKNK